MWALLCVNLHQLCQFSNEKSAPSAVLSFAQKKKAHHTVGMLLFQLPPPAFLQVAFAKVVLLISNIFDFQCEMYYLRPPKRRQKTYGRGRIIQKSVGEVSHRPGALNMLWVGENVELRTWSSPAQTPQVKRELRMPDLAVRFHFPCHNLNCLPHVG